MIFTQGVVVQQPDTEDELVNLWSREKEGVQA
jgi:hypothetical protein